MSTILIKITKITQTYGGNTYTKTPTENEIKKYPELYTIPVYSSDSHTEHRDDGNDVNVSLDSSSIELKTNNGIYFGSIFNYLTLYNIENGEKIPSSITAYGSDITYTIETTGGKLVCDSTRRAGDYQAGHNIESATEGSIWSLTSITRYESVGTNPRSTKTLHTNCNRITIYDKNNNVAGRFYVNSNGPSWNAVKRIGNFTYGNADWNDCENTKIPLLRPKPIAPYELTWYSRGCIPFIVNSEYSFDTLTDISNIITSNHAKNNVMFNADIQMSIAKTYLGIYNDVSVPINFSHAMTYYNEETDTFEKIPLSSWNDGTFGYNNACVYDFKHITEDLEFQKLIGDMFDASTFYGDCKDGYYQYLANFFKDNESNTIDVKDVDTTDGSSTTNRGGNGTNASTASAGGNGTYNVVSETISNDALPTLDAFDTGFVSTYNVTASNLQAFANWMWSTDFIDNLHKLFDDPSSAIISLQQTYAPLSGTNATIKVGNMTSNITGVKLDKQFAEIDLGTITIKEIYGAYFDYSQGATAEIYLPFVGTKQLDINTIMNSTITITYQVDIMTGNCVALLHVKKLSKIGQNKLDSTVYQFEGNMNNQLPFTSKNYAELYKSILSGVSSAIAIV